MREWERNRDRLCVHEREREKERSMKSHDKFNTLTKILTFWQHILALLQQYCSNILAIHCGNVAAVAFFVCKWDCGNIARKMLPQKFFCNTLLRQHLFWQYLKFCCNTFLAIHSFNFLNRCKKVTTRQTFCIKFGLFKNEKDSLWLHDIREVKNYFNQHNMHIISIELKI